MGVSVVLPPGLGLEERKRTYKRLYMRGWTAANRPHARASKNRLRAANPEPHREEMRRYRIAHPDAYNRWRLTPAGQAHDVRHRGWRASNPVTFYLNSPFPGSHLHHAERNIGVFIPKGLHRSVYHCLESGRGMVQINELAALFLEGTGT